MKKIKYLIFGLGVATLASCSSEAPFEGMGTDGEGRILSSAFDIVVLKEDYDTRAVETPDAADFNINIYNVSNAGSVADAGKPLATYAYKDVPEIITVPVGEYIVTADYGGDYGEGKTAAFSAPYFLGESERFTIENGKILDTLEPVVCKPANVKVSVTFDKELAAVMGNGSKVAVRVGQSGLLDFTPQTQEDGYFVYDNGSTTLTATFTGTIDGAATTEVKTYDGVKPGLFYRVQFKLHKVDPNDPNYPDDPNNPNNPDDPNVPDDPTPPDNPTPPDDPTPGVEGSIETGDSPILLDASVTYMDLYGDSGHEPNQEGSEYLVDNMRPGNINPGEDEDPGWEDPGIDNPGPNVPDNPGPDTPPTEKHNPPTVKGINGTQTSNVNPTSFTVEITSESDKGITAFTCDIISAMLDKPTLEGVGLTDHLDLINPGEFRDKIKGLGFPVENEVKGQKRVVLSISSDFLELLKVLGNGTTGFRFNVTDEYGTTSQTISITFQ